jgi:hypothetical protein
MNLKQDSCKCSYYVNMMCFQNERERVIVKIVSFPISLKCSVEYSLHSILEIGSIVRCRFEKNLAY